MVGLVEILMMVGANSPLAQIPYNEKRHAAVYAQAEQPESCEALIKALLPKYNILNQLADIKASYSGTIKRDNSTVWYHKDFVIKVFNSAVPSQTVRHFLKGKEAEEFLKNEKYDVVEIHDIAGMPPMPRMSALLYRGEDRTYIMLKDKIFCEKDWNFKLIEKAIEAISHETWKKQPIQPTPPRRKQRDILSYIFKT